MEGAREELEAVQSIFANEVTVSTDRQGRKEVDFSLSGAPALKITITGESFVREWKLVAIASCCQATEQAYLNIVFSHPLLCLLLCDSSLDALRSRHLINL